MIRESRFWISGWGRYLFVLPVAMALIGLYSSAGSARSLLAGGPMLSMLAYAGLVAMLGRTDVEIDSQGFRMRYGPLPSGIRGEEHPKERVAHVFPRHIREGQGRGVWVDHYYAAAEMTDGRWLNLRGPYPGWAPASEASREVATLWNLREVAGGRSGFPGGRDWAGARVAIVWGGLFCAGLVWGAAVETGWLR